MASLSASSRVEAVGPVITWNSPACRARPALSVAVYTTPNQSPFRQGEHRLRQGEGVFLPVAVPGAVPHWCQVQQLLSVLVEGGGDRDEAQRRVALKGGWFDYRRKPGRPDPDLAFGHPNGVCDGEPPAQPVDGKSAAGAQAGELLQLLLVEGAVRTGDREPHREEFIGEGDRQLPGEHPVLPGCRGGGQALLPIGDGEEGLAARPVLPVGWRSPRKSPAFAAGSTRRNATW